MIVCVDFDIVSFQLIALLARHHRKKFPKRGHISLEGFTDEVYKCFFSEQYSLCANLIVVFLCFSSPILRVIP